MLWYHATPSLFLLLLLTFQWQLLKQHYQEVPCSNWQCKGRGRCDCIGPQSVLQYVELAFELGLPIDVQNYLGRPEDECALYTFRYIAALSPQVERQVNPKVLIWPPVFVH